jgi:5-methyltetrahydrofolate--homocysteine methyltransferase
VVTLGAPVVAECRRLGREGRVLEQFLLHGLAAELTEALAEWSAASIAARAGWNGHRRYSPGYPVWPELSEQRKVFRLLRPSRIGVRLTRSFQMVPEYSTSAIVLPVGPRD